MPMTTLFFKVFFSLAFHLFGMSSNSVDMGVYIYVEVSTIGVRSLLPLWDFGD